MVTPMKRLRPKDGCGYFLVKDMDIAGIGLSQGKPRIAGSESSGRVNAERDMPALILLHAVSVAQSIIKASWME